MQDDHDAEDAQSTALGRRRKKLRLLHAVAEHSLHTVEKGQRSQHERLDRSDGLKSSASASSAMTLAQKKISIPNEREGQATSWSRKANEPTRKRCAPALRIPNLPVPPREDLEGLSQSIVFGILDKNAGFVREALSASGGALEIVHPSSKALVISALAPEPVQDLGCKPVCVHIFSYLDSATDSGSASPESRSRWSEQPKSELACYAAKRLVFENTGMVHEGGVCQSGRALERLVGDGKQGQEEQALRYHRVLSNRVSLMSEISRRLDEVDLVYLSCGSTC